jgi:hypothetical protein
MKRFEFEDGDEFQDENLFPEEEDGSINLEYIRLLEKKELIEVLKVQLYQKEINHELLLRTIKYLSKGLFWKFKSQRRKLQLILETYQTFKILIDVDSLVANEEQTEE